MADDKVDEESAQTGGEDENDAPKKSFGILAARFLQKGKSSPGSITGEFEALTPPDPAQAQDTKVRKIHPVDDEEEDIREGSIHGMEVPLGESLYADIGLDDMSGIDDDAGSHTFVADTSHEAEPASPDVIYDIDAGEQPVISFGSGIEPEHAADIELASSEDFQSSELEMISAGSSEDNYQPVQHELEAASAHEEPIQYDEQAVAQDEPAQYEEQTVAHDEPAQYEEQPVAHEEPIQYEDQPLAHEEPIQYDEHAVAHDEPVQYEEQPVAHDEPIQYEEQAVAHDEPVQYEEQAIAHDEPIQYDEHAVAHDEPVKYEEHAVAHDQDDYQPSEVDNQTVAPTSAYDLSELDSIGVKSDSTFDKNSLDQIDAGKETADTAARDSQPQERKGLLGKFAGKKDSAKSPMLGGGSKPDQAEIAPSQPYDAAALDSIGTKGFDKSALDSIGTTGFDKSALDAIGTTGFDKSALDAIGTTGFDKSALDAIGTKGFDKNALDSIGTKGFDKGALDSIGTKGFDKNELDSIGEQPASPPEAKDKAPKGGGLLGGKFGQKAKSQGADKPKVGGINPPSVDPNFDQKETGRFMVSSESIDAYGAALNAGLNTAAAADFSAPAAETSADTAVPDEATSVVENENAETPISYEEHVPVIGADEVGRLITDADNAYRLRQFKAAEPIFANVLEKLDKIGDDSDPLLPYCLDKMADNLYQLKKYNEALQYFRRLLVLHTKISSDDRDMISTLYKIAQSCEALSLTSEADSMYKRAFRLGQQSLVPGDPLLAKVLEGYGTMLMRSEGAEPAETAEKSEGTSAASPRAEVQSALSAEEIAMLNSLGASSERSAADPSPIILSGGPVSDQSSSKSRSPLKQSDERADKVRASGPSGGSTAGGVWVRLGIFLSVIVGLILVTLNIKTDYSAHNVAHSKDFVKRVYKSADGGATFTIASEDEATKDNFGKHFNYQYRDWNGTPSDDMEVISGQVNGDNFIYEIPQGIKDGSGNVFYEPHASELGVIAKMRELGSKAQSFYKTKGKYPDGKDLEGLANSVGYKNPFAEGTNSIAANSIAWPPNLDATQLLMKSRFDTSMENGDLWEGEPAGKAGLITAASSSQKQPDASVLYIHGRDRDGKLITRADGKVLVLIYKNGIDVTPGAADYKNEKPGPVPAPMRLSKKDGSITALTIMLSYIPILLFLVLSLIFLAMLNKGSGKVGNFSIPTFGIMWSPVMVLLTGLAKFVPAPYSTAAAGLAAVVFVGGAGWLAFNVLKNRPKKA